MTGRKPADPWASMVGGLTGKPQGRASGIQSEADAAQWLARAAKIIQTSGERPQLKLKCGATWLIAHFRLPGVLTLTPEGEAEPIATSKPGEPSTVATWRECL
jgi:hypothetical protein